MPKPPATLLLLDATEAATLPCRRRAVVDIIPGAGETGVIGGCGNDGVRSSLVIFSPPDCLRVMLGIRLYRAREGLDCLATSSCCTGSRCGAGGGI